MLDRLLKDNRREWQGDPAQSSIEEPCQVAQLHRLTQSPRQARFESIQQYGRFCQLYADAREPIVSDLEEIMNITSGDDLGIVACQLVQCLVQIFNPKVKVLRYYVWIPVADVHHDDPRKDFRLIR